MRQVVDQAGRDLPEHRLPLLLSDVLLQLHEPVGHRVEGVAELPDLVAPRHGDPLVHAPVRNRPRRARQREDARDERAAPDRSHDDRAEQRETDRDEQLPLQPVQHAVGLRRRLLDDDDPGQVADFGANRENLVAVGVVRPLRDRRRGLRDDVGGEDLFVQVRG